MPTATHCCASSGSSRETMAEQARVIARLEQEVAAVRQTVAT